jgi:hypothetical protein
MVKDIRFKFMPYYNDMDEEDYHNFDLWGKLDILIDGVSFFSNYNYPENGGPLRMTKEGFVGQLATFLSELPEVPQRLLDEETVVVEDDSTSKCLVFSLRDNIVSFAICEYESTLPPWQIGIYYDGVGVSHLEKIPQTEKNIIEIIQFNQGLKNGLQNFIQELIEQYPNIIKDESFINIRNTVDSIN